MASELYNFNLFSVTICHTLVHVRWSLARCHGLYHGRLSWENFFSLLRIRGSTSLQELSTGTLPEGKRPNVGLTILSLPTAGAKNLWTFASLLGRRVIGISGSLIWSKTLTDLIFNPCGEFRWSPENPVSQIHSLHLLVGAPGIFLNLWRFVQMLKREWDAKTTGSYRTYSSLVKLQPRFLRLQCKSCLWA